MHVAESLRQGGWVTVSWRPEQPSWQDRLVAARSSLRRNHLSRLAAANPSQQPANLLPSFTE